MLFCIKGHAQFEAESIDDAFKVLAEHFVGLAAYSPESSTLVGGSLEISRSELCKECKGKDA